MGECVKLFPDEDINRAFRLKKIMLVGYFVCLGLVLGLIVSLLLVNQNMVATNYDRSKRGLFTFISAFTGSAFAVLSLFFFSVKFRLTRRYVKMLKGFKSGILDTSTVTFLAFEKNEVFKDGVYFYTMIVDSKPLRRDDITERRILIEHTVLAPNFLEGDKIKVVTHGNILVEYERLV